MELVPLVPFMVCGFQQCQLTTLPDTTVWVVFEGIAYSSALPFCLLAVHSACYTQQERTHSHPGMPFSFVSSFSSYGAWKLIRNLVIQPPLYIITKTPSMIAVTQAVEVTITHADRSLAQEDIFFCLSWFLTALVDVNIPMSRRHSQSLGLERK